MCRTSQGFLFERPTSVKLFSYKRMYDVEIFHTQQELCQSTRYFEARTYDKYGPQSW